MQWKQPQYGDFRVRTLFAWETVKLGHNASLFNGGSTFSHTGNIWLERYTVREKYSGSGFWNTWKAWPGGPKDEPEDVT